MKLFITIWFTILLTSSIGTIAIISSKFAEVNLKNIPPNEFWWLFLSMFNIAIMFYFSILYINRTKK